MVEYDAVAGGGANNLNFILYASNPPKGLLETTGQRTGAYSEYHVFPNYIVTYLSPEGEPSWRIRFRKNPGFRLLTERYVDRDAPKDRKQRLTYVLDDNGVMRFFVDGRLLHQYQDQDAPYREGRHGFRTWHSLVKYSNFKVYAIEGRRDANR